jgi:hypothetical protein
MPVLTGAQQSQFLFSILRHSSSVRSLMQGGIVTWPTRLLRKYQTKPNFFYSCWAQLRLANFGGLFLVTSSTSVTV